LQRYPWQWGAIQATEKQHPRRAGGSPRRGKQRPRRAGPCCNRSCPTAEFPQLIWSNARGVPAPFATFLVSRKFRPTQTATPSTRRTLLQPLLFSGLKIPV